MLTSASNDGHGFYRGLNVVDDKDKPERQQLVDEIATATKDRALHITAALILAAWENYAADPFTWRRARSSRNFYAGETDSAFYLAAMKAWGYELSSIEQALVDDTPWVAP